MKLRTKASLIASFCAVPFIGIAATYWHLENQKGFMGYGYWLGDQIFNLGAPMTLLFDFYIRKTGPLKPGDDWWATPVMCFLFVFQWIIWAQLIVWIRQRRLRQGQAS